MMTLPKTLLQIAGAPLTPSALDRSALILIDHQLEYVTGAIPLSGIEAAVAEAAKLLDLARTHSVPVFHVVHHGRPGAAAFSPQGPYAAIMPELLPIENEKVVIKSLPNAFAGTNLHHLIQEVGRKELIIAGFATHMCVSTTTRAALDLGYRSTVVANATASRDLPLVDGKGVIPAEIVRQTALAELADRFAIIVPDTAILSSSGV
ncbi:cysteine hydrolase family protein [Rhizobium sp. BR 314]|uniref:cysteine hydrolase family protein n=1 Tax=Rhizobium sp. BR 314 TaxID=3040013 RepID=UPI0039BFEF9D